MKRELTEQEKESLLKTAIDHPTFVDELSAYQKSELIELIQVKLQWIDKSINKLMLSNPEKNDPDYWRARLSKGVFTYNNLIEVQASILDQYGKREPDESLSGEINQDDGERMADNDKQYDWRDYFGDNYWRTAEKYSKNGLQWNEVFEKIALEMESLGIDLRHTSYDSFMKGKNKSKAAKVRFEELE